MSDADSRRFPDDKETSEILDEIQDFVTDPALVNNDEDHLPEIADLPDMGEVDNPVVDVGGEEDEAPEINTDQEDLFPDDRVSGEDAGVDHDSEEDDSWAYVSDDGVDYLEFTPPPDVPEVTPPPLIDDGDGDDFVKIPMEDDEEPDLNTTINNPEVAEEDLESLRKRYGLFSDDDQGGQDDDTSDTPDDQGGQGWAERKSDDATSYGVPSVPSIPISSAEYQKLDDLNSRTGASNEPVGKAYVAPQVHALDAQRVLSDGFVPKVSRKQEPKNATVATVTMIIVGFLVFFIMVAVFWGSHVSTRDVTYHVTSTNSSVGSMTYVTDRGLSHSDGDIPTPVSIDTHVPNGSEFYVSASSRDMGNPPVVSCSIMVDGVEVAHSVDVGEVTCIAGGQ